MLTEGKTVYMGNILNYVAKNHKIKNPINSWTSERDGNFYFKLSIKTSIITSTTGEKFRKIGLPFLKKEFSCKIKY